MAGKGPLRSHADYWATKTIKHDAFSKNLECRLNTFPLLNGSMSMPSFLNEANLQLIKQACIADDRYYDLFTQLQTLFLAHGVNLTDGTLRRLAQGIHKDGCVVANDPRPHNPMRMGSLRLTERNRVLDALRDALVGVTVDADIGIDEVAVDVTRILVEEVHRHILIAGDTLISHCRHNAVLKESL